MSIFSISSNGEGWGPLVTFGCKVWKGEKGKKEEFSSWYSQGAMPFQLILEAFGAKGDSLEMLVAIQHQPLHTSNGKKKK